MSEAPIRLLSLTYAETSHANAQQVNAREIAARLSPERFRVELLSDGVGDAPIGRLPHVSLLRLGPRGRAVAITRRLLRGGYDLLLYPGPGLPEAIYVRLPRFLACRRARVLLPVEGNLAQLDEVPSWIRRRVDRLLQRADAVFPITDFVAETLRDRCGRTGSVVPVGVDLGLFRPRQRSREPGPLRVLSVGTVKAWKRPELVRAAARAFPSAEFTWLGEGDLREGEVRQAPANLRFPGACGRDALPDRYRQADLLLHPSRMEGLPKVVLEAMASGLPVVVFDTWRPDFVREAGAGFVVRDEAGMVEALRRLADEEGLRDSMGRAAREAAGQFSWDVVAARWAAVFEREAALAHAPGPQEPVTPSPPA